jgi:hypothetical protein
MYHKILYIIMLSIIFGSKCCPLFYFVKYKAQSTPNTKIKLSFMPLNIINNDIFIFHYHKLCSDGDLNIIKNKKHLTIIFMIYHLLIFNLSLINILLNITTPT